MHVYQSKDGQAGFGVTSYQTPHKLLWLTLGLNPKRLAIGGMITMHKNNWLRQILYFFNAPRKWIRKV